MYVKGRSVTVGWAGEVGGVNEGRDDLIKTSSSWLLLMRVYLSQCRTSTLCRRSATSTGSRFRFRFRRRRQPCTVSATADLVRRRSTSARRRTIRRSPPRRRRRGTDCRNPSARGILSRVRTTQTARFARRSPMLFRRPSLGPSHRDWLSRFTDIELWTMAGSPAVFSCLILQMDYLRL